MAEMIREVIIVEGKNDVRAVKNAVDAECIMTHGHGFSEDFLDTLEEIEKRRGLIILTDPDYAGKKIRKRIKERIPTAKDAYIDRNLASKAGDIGIENCRPEWIQTALNRARATLTEKREVFSMDDLLRCGLVGASGSKERRIALAQALGIGYGNARRLLAMLNDYGFTKEDVERALKGEEYDD